MADQALSLQCTECGVQLRSVKEAQDHGEATGHSSFEESTEAVQRLVCRACGKPCRTETERSLHAQRTGHAEFEDQTHADTKPLDTEAEMAEASGADGDAAPSSEPELVEPVVSEAALQELEGMGFSRNRAVRALHGTGTDSVEAAVTWLEQHGEDTDIDMPLLVPKEAEKLKLSPEEAKARAAELLQKARMRREAEERERERLREQERIRAGKELLVAQRQEEDLKLKRAAEARRLDKEEERRARDKIRVKLEEDKRERRRRLGLPPDPTPEELAADAERAAQRATEEAAKKLPPPVVVGDADALRDVLVSIKKQAGEGGAARVTTCFQTLFKLCGNVAGQPDNPKFRRVNLGNAALSARLLPGAADFLLRVGWTVAEGDLVAGDAVLELPTGRPDEAARLAVAGAQLDSALNNPFFGVL